MPKLRKAHQYDVYCLAKDSLVASLVAALFGVKRKV